MTAGVLGPALLILSLQQFYFIIPQGITEIQLFISRSRKSGSIVSPRLGTGIQSQLQLLSCSSPNPHLQQVSNVKTNSSI